MHDLVIRAGTVVDGTGDAPAPPTSRSTTAAIVEVGRVDGGGARRTIDADGLLVTPGFVDVHTHYDGQATWDAAPHAVVLARRHHRGHGQLRRRLRAGARRRTDELAHRADGGRGGHPRHRARRGHPLGAGSRSPSISTRSTACPSRERRGAGPPRRGPRLRDGGPPPRARDRRRPRRDARDPARAEPRRAVGFSTGRTAGPPRRRGEPVPGTYAPDTEIAALLAVMARGAPRRAAAGRPWAPRGRPGSIRSARWRPKSTGWSATGDLPAADHLPHPRARARLRRVAWLVRPGAGGQRARCRHPPAGGEPLLRHALRAPVADEHVQVPPELPADRRSSAGPAGAGLRDPAVRARILAEENVDGPFAADRISTARPSRTCSPRT